MIRAKATVRGDREVIANIRRAQRSVGGRFMDASAKEALQPMKERTEENARKLRNFPGKHPGWPQPSGTPRGGHLDQGVTVVKKEADGFYRGIYWLTFTKRARKIAHLVEIGTAPHYQPNRKIMHPGAQPYPFARPAFESEKDGVVDELGNRVWRQIAGSLLAGFRK